MEDTTTPELRHVAVGEDKSFVLSSGERLFTLDQLSEAINLIDPDTFHHHVNAERNDFANWVQHVFPEVLGEEDAAKLADAMRAKRGPLGQMIAVEKFLRMKELAAEKAATPAA